MAETETRTSKHGPSIDKLLDFFVAEDGTAYYQVKWKPTWEKAEALSQFSNLIDNFWNFVNNAHTGNIYNNHCIKKEPIPDLPSSAPAQSGPRTPKSRRNSYPPKFNTPTQSVSTTSSSNSSMPPSTVIIDSDEDENITEESNPVGSLTTSLQNSMSTQQQFGTSPMWSAKTEPTEIPDQKPFEHGALQNYAMGNNQFPSSLQQFQFPAQNHGNSVPTNNGGQRGRGRGRGRGGNSGAKRKLISPNNPSPSKQQAPTTKVENLDELNSISGAPPQIYDLSASPPSNENTSGKWEDYFEIIEKKNFDGTSLETLFKCTVCGTVISNKGSCRRHFNIHSGEKSHVCPICKKAFHRFDYMQRHLKVHGQGDRQELEGLVKLAMESVKK